MRPPAIGTSRLFFVVAVAIIAAGCGHKQEPPKKPRQPTPSKAQTPTMSCGENRPVLFRVEGDGAPSFILGTIPEGFGVDDVLVGDCRKALDIAKVIVLQADTRHQDDVEAMAPAVLTGGHSLRASLGNDPWELLISHVGHKMPPLLLDRVWPWYAHRLIVQMRMREAVKQMRPDAVDRTFESDLLALADKQGKKLVFLETAAQEGAALSRAPLSAQAEYLKAELSPNPILDMNSLVGAYETGDLRHLAKATLRKELVEQHRSVFEAWVFARNKAWAKSLEESFDEGGLFMAVDVAHLLGQEGLPATLQEMGFAVGRVP